jgi:hypothetical protein
LQPAIDSTSYLFRTDIDFEGVQIYDHWMSHRIDSITSFAQCAMMAAVIAGIGFTASHAAAQDQPPSERLRYSSLTVGRVNPLGLITRNDLTYRWRLFDSDSAISRDNHFGIGGIVVLSPAFARVGPMIEIQPLSILEIRAAYETFSYFGTFNLFQSFQFVDEDFSDAALDRFASSDDEDSRNYSTSGTQFTLAGVLRLKFGPVALRNTFRLMRADFDLRDGDQLFYDQIWDLLVPDEGWYMNNDVDVLVFLGERWKVGARWTYATAFYRDADFRPGEPQEDINNPTNRVGPTMIYTFPSKSAVFKDPSLLVIANWWVQNRFRTGEEISVALPYIVVGFTFNGDIWTSAD